MRSSRWIHIFTVLISMVAIVFCVGKLGLVNASASNDGNGLTINVLPATITDFDEMSNTLTMDVTVSAPSSGGSGGGGYTPPTPTPIPTPTETPTPTPSQTPIVDKPIDEHVEF